MRAFSCFCGTTIEADDLDDLIAPARAHLNEAHGFGLTDANTRDYFEAEDRLSPVRPRLEDIGEIDIHPATPDRLDDVLHFFDYEGFAGKPEWAACYCTAHHLTQEEDTDGYCRARNRALIAERINEQSTTGLLAYADGRVAAWCNATPRSQFPHYKGRDELDDDNVGSIVCFVVAPPYRRHGVAVKLMVAACSTFVERGFAYAEAYPNKESRDDASAYHGPYAMYMDAGFSEIGQLDQYLTVVRKALT